MIWNRIYLMTEWLLLFAVYPIAVRAGWLGMHREIYFAPGILYALVVYLVSKHPKPRVSGDYPAGRLAVRMVLASIALLATAYWAVPDSFMSLPLRNTLPWLGMVVLYPPVSALPQEFVYRQFYFWRYASLFKSERVLTVTSALVFGFMHIIYANALAVTLTLAGGWMFATLYRRTHNLYYPWLEHSVYGLILLTAGMQSVFMMK